MDLIAAAEKFAEETNKNPWGSLVCFGHIDKEGKVDKVVDICYYSLLDRIKRWGGDNLIVLHPGRSQGKLGGNYATLCWYRQNKTDHSPIPWTEYLLSDDTPFTSLRDKLKVKDVEWICKNGLLFEDFGSVDCRLLYCYLIAHRQCFEFPDSNAAFEFLVKEKGVQPNLAAYASFYLMALDDEGKEWCKKVPSGHQALGHFYPSETHKRWLSKDPMPDCTIAEMIGGKYPTKYGSESIFVDGKHDYNAKWVLPVSSLDEVLTAIQS